MSIFKDKVTYEKVEMIGIGLIIPLFISGFVSYKLIFEDITYFGRGSTIKFHGFEALLVSSFWYGLAVCIFAGFFVRYLKWRKASYTTLSFGLLLMVIGLGAALKFTFWS